MTEDTVKPDDNRDDSGSAGPGNPAKLSSAASERPVGRRLRIPILLRRIHLYSGLLMLPWVLLYGITGAMFNHPGLLPRLKIEPIPEEMTEASGIRGFPAPEELADAVTDAVRRQMPQADVQHSAAFPPQFTNELMFSIRDDGEQKVIYLDPMTGAGWLSALPANPEQPKSLVDFNRISLPEDPQVAAREAAEKIFTELGYPNRDPQPFGWTKLNFPLVIDGTPARVTYVLKDGHIDVTEYTGQDGLPLRDFLLRAHTTHVQPPHWNGRMYWSLVADAMAAAMVLWAATGLFMWWQLKRARWTGVVMLLISVGAAAFFFLSLHGFYATTKL